MPSSTTHIEWVREQQGLEAAYAEACREVRRRAEEVEALWASRFFERRQLDNGSKKLWPVTEEQISRAYDLQDADPDIPEYLYCDEAGELHPVTVGAQSRFDTDEEAPFVYASAPLMANGSAVGQVLYTDH